MRRSPLFSPSHLASDVKRPHQNVKWTHHRVSSAIATPDQSLYQCDANVEPLRRYRPGGYHPIHIGDTLGDRYTVLHKLGWGGFSTVWAVRDLREQKCLALKAVVSKKHGQTREIEIMQAINSSKSHHPGLKHLFTIHDHFQVHGPNGTHDCLIMDIAGSSVRRTIRRQWGYGRLPGQLARRISKQVALGVACLHEQQIGHMDLHTGNVVLSGANSAELSRLEHWQGRGQPETEPVKRKDGQPLGENVPKYLVYPVSLPSETPPACSAKIVDFGESILNDDKPRRLRTPLVVRPPEAIFKDAIDLRADLWSLGCILFELATGQPPFDSFMMKPPTLVEQMLETTGEALPQRWQKSWLDMADGKPFAKSGMSLQEWLEEVYFDEDEGEDDDWEPDLTKEDIKDLGQVIQRLLRLEPSERASVREILECPWFRKLE